MKALLVQSPATSPWVPRRQWEPPSIALATIAAQIDNHDVRVADMIVWRKRSVAKFRKILQEFKPDIVGFSSMTFQYDTALRFAYLTKEFNRDILTVLGGYHATLFYEQIADSADSEYWDFLVRGEGDFSFGELLDCLEANGSGLEKVLGLSYKRSEGFCHNPPRPLEDLTRIKIPARDKRILKGFHMYFRKADVIETSRGCLHLVQLLQHQGDVWPVFQGVSPGKGARRHRGCLSARRAPYLLHRRQHHSRHGEVRGPL